MEFVCVHGYGTVYFWTVRIEVWDVRIEAFWKKEMVCACHSLLFRDMMKQGRNLAVMAQIVSRDEVEGNTNDGPPSSSSSNEDAPPMKKQVVLVTKKAAKSMRKRSRKNEQAALGRRVRELIDKHRKKSSSQTMKIDLSKLVEDGLLTESEDEESSNSPK